MMKNSSEFREADKELGKIWKKIKPLIGKHDPIFEEQRRWISKRRDEVAQRYRDEGYDTTQAYIKSTLDRIEELKEIYEHIHDINGGKSQDEKASRESSIQQEPQNSEKQSEKEIFSKDKYVTVIADGSGVKKLEALDNAWKEAAKQAVGQFISVENIVDDHAIEKIVQYSKGKSNSFKILSEKRTPNGWNIKIQAHFDKDIVKEASELIDNNSEILIE